MPSSCMHDVDVVSAALEGFHSLGDKKITSLARDCHIRASIERLQTLLYSGIPCV